MKNEMLDLKNCVILTLDKYERIIEDASHKVREKALSLESNVRAFGCSYDAEEVARRFNDGDVKTIKLTAPEAREYRMIEGKLFVEVKLENNNNAH